MPPDPLESSLVDLARDLRERSLSASALVESAIARHERCGRELSAYRVFDPRRAREQARAADAAFAAGAVLGPLQGIPVSIKDLYGLRGFQTFAGSARTLPDRFEAEGPLVRRLRRQLAVMGGKTHTVEFAFGGIGTSPHFPTPRNPWDAEAHRVPGGSSAGAGVSLAEGSALVAMGTDTAGSVRIPASFTGQVGLKTTFGRWSMEGIVPLSPTLDTAGVLTRTVGDAVFAFATLDPAWGDPEAFEAVLERPEPAGISIGITDDLFFDDCSLGVAEGVRTAVDELIRAGVRARALALPEVHPAIEIFMKANPVAVELRAFLESELPDWQSTLDPNVAARLERAAEVTAVDYLSRIRRLRSLAAPADGRLQQVDVLVTPTVAITPPKVDDLSTPEAYRKANLLALRNTSVVSYLGLCALTMPVAKDAAGMPVGMQLIARGGREEHLLAVAGTFEHILGAGPTRLGRPPLP